MDEEGGVGKPVGLCFKFEGIPCLLLLLILFFTKDETETNVNETEDFSFERKNKFYLLSYKEPKIFLYDTV